MVNAGHIPSILQSQQQHNFEDNIQSMSLNSKIKQTVALTRATWVNELFGDDYRVNICERGH